MLYIAETLEWKKNPMEKLFDTTNPSEGFALENAERIDTKKRGT